MYSRFYDGIVVPQGGDFVRKIKAFRLAIFAIACWLFIVTVVPSFYERSTRDIMRQELTAAYEAAVDDEYNALIREYVQDKKTYDAEMTTYLLSCEEYEKYLVSYNEECAAYEDAHAQALAQYEKDLQQHNDAKTARQVARDKAYKEAENKKLKDGIEFTVNVQKTMDYNRSVGNEWRWGATINGEGIPNTGKMVFKLGSKIKLYSRVVEDDNVPDVGSATGYYTLEREDFNTAFDLTQAKRCQPIVLLLLRDWITSEHRL